MPRKVLVRIVLISLAFATVSVALLGMPESSIQYWYLYYSPVLLAAFSFGLRGALVGTVLTTVHVLFFYWLTGITRASLPRLLDELAQMSEVPSRQALEWLLSVDYFQGANLPFELTQALLGVLFIMAGAVITGWLVDQNRSKERMLEEQATTDGLTGLANHRKFQERLLEEVKRAERCRESFALLMADLDHLKGVNDVHGHLAGDEALRIAAKAMSASVRSIDLVARYGGEEFAIMLLHVDVRLAQAVAERVRTFVERQVVAVAQGKTIPVTVSIGVALFPHDAGDSQSLIAAADSALYRAKQQGRNCVSLYSVPAEADTTETARGTLLGRTDVGPLESLALALEAKDHFTHGHSEAVTNYSLAIADALSLPQDCLEALRAASLLHDIGKVGIPDSVLNKPGPLTSEERKLVQAHTINGERVLRSLPRLDDVLPAVLHHHERYDGAGYPAGLAGADIPLLARILAVADAFEAMTADRPYRSRLSREAAIAELRRGAGKQFDPEIVEAFLKGEVRSAVPSSAEPGAAEAQQGLGRMVPEV